MAQLLSLHSLFSDFNQTYPLAKVTPPKAGAIAAWMDWCAAYCQIPCSEQSTPDLDKLAKLIRWEVEVAKITPEVILDALAMAAYTFRAANGVLWPISLARLFEGSQHQQMQGITKAEQRALTKNTQEHLAWKAEIAARHGGDYKHYIERMLEPVSGFNDLNDRRIEMIRAGQEIRILARTNLVRMGPR